MLTSLRIKNFKAWKDTGDIRLAPLTIIFGANSAGKSSLGHLLLALKQTVSATDRHQALQLSKPLINLGSFKDCLYNHDLNNALEFELGWRVNSQLSNPTNPKSSYLKLKTVFTSDIREQPQVQSISYQWDIPKNIILSDGTTILGDEKIFINYKKIDAQEDQYEFFVDNKRFIYTDLPTKFYIIPSDKSNILPYSEKGSFYKKDVGFLIDLDLALNTESTFNQLYYLEPLRNPPERLYLWSGESPESVGMRGENVIPAMLSAHSQQRKIKILNHQNEFYFDELIAYQLKKLGIIENFIVKPIAEGRSEHEVLVKTHPHASEVKIADVGFGVSQVLPALVQAFYCPPDSTVWMEQPEIHLHPQAQAELADVFIDAIKAQENGEPRNTQFIIESHSEHFLNRLQRRLAEEVITPDDISVYFCHKATDDKPAELEPLKLNEFGDIENWPENFFGDEMADIAARTLAAIQRKKNAQSKGKL